MKKLLLLVILTTFMLPAATDARYHEGDSIADFSLPDTSGSLVSLSDYSDKIVCIYFWAST